MLYLLFLLDSIDSLFHSIVLIVAEFAVNVNHDFV
jgi:hypothetical protein